MHVGLRQRLICGEAAVDVGGKAFVLGLAHLRTIPTAFGDDLRQVAGTRKLLHRGGRHEVGNPDRVAGIRNDKALERNLKLRNRLQR